MLLEGLFLPLTTPFYGDGRLYLRKLEHNAERYSRTLAAGLAILTPIAEPTRLTDEEHREALKSAAAATARETLLLADISRGGVRAALEAAESAAALDYDVAILRLPPAGRGSSPEEQRTLALAVADRSPLPLIVLEERGEALPVELISGLAEHDQIIGWIASASPLTSIGEVLARTATVQREVTVTPTFTAVTRRMLRPRVSAVAPNYISSESLQGGGVVVMASTTLEPPIKTRSRTVGFQVLAGRTEGSLAALQGGAKGLMLPFGICAPQACHEVFAAWKDDDKELAAEKYGRIAKAATLIEEVLGVAGLKSACDLNGYFGGAPRLPGLPLLRAQQDEAKLLMRGMRN